MANEREDLGELVMKSRHAEAAVETPLTGLRLQLQHADHELRSLRAMIKRTKEAIRSSREAIVRTNTLVLPDERSDTE